MYFHVNHLCVPFLHLACSRGDPAGGQGHDLLPQRRVLQRRGALPALAAARRLLARLQLRRPGQPPLPLPEARAAGALLRAPLLRLPLPGAADAGPAQGGGGLPGRHHEPHDGGALQAGPRGDRRRGRRRGLLPALRERRAQAGGEVHDGGQGLAEQGAGAAGGGPAPEGGGAAGARQGERGGDVEGGADITGILHYIICCSIVYYIVCLS